MYSVFNFRSIFILLLFFKSHPKKHTLETLISRIRFNIYIAHIFYMYNTRYIQPKNIYIRRSYFQYKMLLLYFKHFFITFCSYLTLKKMWKCSILHFLLVFLLLSVESHIFNNKILLLFSSFSHLRCCNFVRVDSHHKIYPTGKFRIS